MVYIFLFCLHSYGKFVFSFTSYGEDIQIFRFENILFNYGIFLHFRWLLHSPRRQIVSKNSFLTPAMLPAKIVNVKLRRSHTFSTLRYEKFIFGSGDASTKNVKIPTKQSQTLEQF